MSILVAIAMLDNFFFFFGSTILCCIMALYPGEFLTRVVYA
jgi:hypothetical protein